MAAKKSTKNASTVAGARLPIWTVVDGAWHSDDLSAMAFMTYCYSGGCLFDLPSFDNWLISFEPKVTSALVEWRYQAQAFSLYNHEAAATAIVLLDFAQRTIGRESQLLPLAKTGLRVRKPREDANNRRSDMARADLATWQSMADSIWANSSHANKSKTWVATQIDPGRASTIRRHISKPTAK